jgi:hypothetical protein
MPYPDIIIAEKPDNAGLLKKQIADANA